MTKELITGMEGLEMRGRVQSLDTLYHLHVDNLYAQVWLIQSRDGEYEVSVRYSDAVDFTHWELGEEHLLSDPHEAMDVYRECYVSLLEEGYCYWGLIPIKMNELERTAERNRLLRLVQQFCHPEALQALRQWRNQQAACEEVRPTAVLSNRSLRSLATFLPQNKEELENCPGIGEVKREYYGDVLLSICTTYTRQFKTPLPHILPKYKLKDDEEKRFLPYRGKRIAVQDERKLRKKALQIGETGIHIEELEWLSKVDDRETRRRVASAANKLRQAKITRSLRHLIFDEGPQVRHYMLRAILSSQLEQEMAKDVSALLEIEPKAYNRILCKRILGMK